jgi:hypothetical protein
VGRAIPNNAINEERLFSPKAIFSIFYFEKELFFKFKIIS